MVYAQHRLSAGALIDVGKISRCFPLVPLAIDAKLTEGDKSAYYITHTLGCTCDMYY